MEEICECATVPLAKLFNRARQQSIKNTLCSPVSASSCRNWTPNLPEHTRPRGGTGLACLLHCPNTAARHDGEKEQMSAELTQHEDRKRIEQQNGESTVQDLTTSVKQGKTKRCDRHSYTRAILTCRVVLSIGSTAACTAQLSSRRSDTSGRVSTVPQRSLMV